MGNTVLTKLSLAYGQLFISNAMCIRNLLWWSAVDKSIFC